MIEDDTDAHPVDGTCSPNQNEALLGELDQLGAEVVNLTKGRQQFK